jgi:hypothetical protein
MGINFAPKWYGLPKSEENNAGRKDDLDFFAAFEAEHAGDSRLPSGWWILPFAAAGLIECYFMIDWIFAHL